MIIPFLLTLTTTLLGCGDTTSPGSKDPGNQEEKAQATQPAQPIQGTPTTMGSVRGPSPGQKATEANVGTVTMPAPTGLCIDGRFDDWNDIPIAFTDPADSPNWPVDIGAVKVAHDDRYVNVMVELGKMVNLQGFDGVGYLLLDVDGDPKTGKTRNGMAGVDAVIELTPLNRDHPEERSKGIGLRSMMLQPPASVKAGEDPLALNPYDVGFLFAPTHSGRRVEMRIARGSRIPDCPPFFVGSQFTFKIEFRALNGTPLDSTDPYTYRLTPTTATPDLTVQQLVDPLVRANGTNLRVASWNIERGGIFLRPEPYARTLKAIDADVLMLQELNDKDTPSGLKGYLDFNLPLPAGQQWIVTSWGSGDGGLHCAIASKKGLGNVPPLDSITMPDNPGKAVRTRSARVILSDAQRILVTSVHLKCCGYAGGPEDLQRINEAKAIHSAIRSVLPGGANAWPEPFSGVIIAGDFNLVGSRTPLDVMGIQLDLDKTWLSIDEPYQLDESSNVTWSDRTQPFTPGRLDYVLYSDSTLKVLKSFVYNSHALAETWRQAHSVHEDDSDHTSDHMPIVTDFSLITPGF